MNNRSKLLKKKRRISRKKKKFKSKNEAFIRFARELMNSNPTKLFNEMMSTPMVKENVMLIQYHDIEDDGKVNDFFNDPTNENDPKVYQSVGYRVHSIYDHNSKELTHYNGSDDSTDLSCLEKKIGYYLVSVNKDEYNNFSWYCMRVGHYLPEKKISAMHGYRMCTEDESKLLDEIYPEFRINCF